MFRRRRMGGVADPPPAAAEPTPMPSVGAAPLGHRYRMVEKLVSFGDDFYIQNDQGQRVFKVDGKALRLRDTLVFPRHAGQRGLQDPGTGRSPSGHDGDRGARTAAAWRWCTRR